MIGLFKNKLSEDYVELTIGRVYFKILTNGMYNKALSKSAIFGSSINNNLFYQLMEYQLLDLSKRKIDNLSVKDGEKVRNKLKEILLRHGLIEEEKSETKETQADIFSKSDIEWFENQKRSIPSKLQKAGLI